MATLHEMINAWIFLNKDEAEGSALQEIHDAVDLLTLSPASVGALDAVVVESDDQTARNADNAHDDTKTYYGYRTVTCWRLNSDTYVFERTQQKALVALVLNG